MEERPRRSGQDQEGPSSSPRPQVEDRAPLSRKRSSSSSAYAHASVSPIFTLVYSVLFVAQVKRTERWFLSRILSVSSPDLVLEGLCCLQKFEFRTM